ncbi:MAG TPA: pyridoxal phosphate-dependent aminotransferase [Candidatus Hydrogenedens sp.]|nr:pyridoxal phosphate-dependent aminotransferase [Candidatus Hydrogenedens sp.]
MIENGIFSEYGLKSSQPSPVNQMMSQFAQDFRPGIDINLGVGYVNEDTIPYNEFADIVRELVNKENRPSNLLNYGGPEGSKRLIDSLKEFYNILYKNGKTGFVPDFENREVVIGVSGATSILTGLANILKKGVVISTDPLYYIFTSTLERYNFEIAPIEEDDEGPRIDILEQTLESLHKAGKYISCCYFVTVNNPTCVVVSNYRRKQIVECLETWAKKIDTKIPLFFDLAYEWLIHDTQLPYPVLPSMFDNCESVYEIGTLSKVFAPALRVGYIISPKNSALLKSLIQWNSDVGFSAPLITQEISAELIRKVGLKQFEFVNTGYRERGTLLKDKFNQKMGQYIESITGGSAGFYLYLTLKGIPTFPDSDLFMLLSRKSGIKDWDYNVDNIVNKRVVYLPGIYCVHPQGTLSEAGKYQLRVSYGYENIGALLQAVDIFVKAIGLIKRQKV